MYDVATKNFVKSLVDDNVIAATNGTPAARTDAPTINIYAERGMVALGGGSNIKHIHPIVLGMILLFVLVFSISCMKISAIQGMNFAAAVHDVAICENKSPNKIHSELRQKYNYQAYASMNMIDYWRAMWNLRGRQCDA